MKTPDWKAINLQHNLPRPNGYGRYVQAGKKYYLLSGDGESYGTTRYLFRDMVEGKAKMESSDGFSFVISIDSLTAIKPVILKSAGRKRLRELRRDAPAKEQKQTCLPAALPKQPYRFSAPHSSKPERAWLSKK